MAYDRREPHPVERIVCSLCGLLWRDHMDITGDLDDNEIENVSANVCVTLLLRRGS